MKIIIIIPIAFLMLFACFAQKPNESKSNNHKYKFKNNYLITKIDSLKNVIIYYAKRNDSIVKIVSIKTYDKNCKKVVVGQRLSLKIKSFFNDSYPQKLDIKGFKVGNTIIKLEKNGVIWDLFASENLEGLCYIECN